MKETIAENIAKLYNDLDNKANRKAIFAHYRSIDESHLWPVSGKFNITERARRRLYKFERAYGERMYGLELCLFLENEISNIVNSI